MSDFDVYDLLEKAEAGDVGSMYRIMLMGGMEDYPELEFEDFFKYTKQLANDVTIGPSAYVAKVILGLLYCGHPETNKFITNFSDDLPLDDPAYGFQLIEEGVKGAENPDICKENPLYYTDYQDIFWAYHWDTRKAKEGKSYLCRKYNGLLQPLKEKLSYIEKALLGAERFKQEVASDYHLVSSADITISLIQPLYDLAKDEVKYCQALYS